MIKEVIWSPAAENDFESILDYLQLKLNDRIVVKFINKVDDNINSIFKDLNKLKF